MKKRALLIIMIFMAAAMCACSSKVRKETDMEAGNGSKQEIMTNDNAEIDMNVFAAGIKVEGVRNEAEADSKTDNTDSGPETANKNGDTQSDPAADIVDGGIEERCPTIYETTRDNVSYGEFIHDTYYSETCGMERGCSILLPADYSEDKKYPVLYLLHGIFGDEYSFSGDKNNKIREIITNMAADGIIGETILVCPNMYATSDPAQKPGFDSESVKPYDNFINDLINDLMPYIEEKYAVLTGRENTCLAGFSMGGRETIFITLSRPELFGYVCAISAAPGIVPTKDKFMAHEGQISESEMKFAEDATEPNVFILCCGTRDSVVGTYPKQYHELLEANGAAHIWYEITGADHDNNAIKSGLYNLLKQIAYDKSKTHER
ncbi:MAG: esterase family protein [Lachnospiraceae bacterium]|nr:esterase family protein [Lachnospiraceae bacterium]